MENKNYKYDIISRALEGAKPADNGCLEFRGSKGLKHRYGVISITLGGVRKNVPAHRALWMATNDRLDLPRDIVIRHTCDNPRCVNIKHLIHGTHKDNARDKIERGRCAKTHKLHTRQARFTDEEIRAIRRGTGKLKWIAEEFGTTIGYVSKIKNMKAKTLV